jgi:hypothetical protein
MDSWNVQLELAKSRIAGIEDKIGLQRQRAEQNDHTAIRLISVMQESLEQISLCLNRGGFPSVCQ